MSETELDPAVLDAAASMIRAADALIICAGAGMGVDSGLPDFRGERGFWKAYPPYEELGLSFTDLADPENFKTDPALAWGFYGHRQNLYRSITPHAGFGILRRWGERMRGGLQVFTTNVDGQFQRAGFEQVTEVHGSIHHLQCLTPCHDGVWSADGVSVRVDETTMRATSAPPLCPECGAVARPNILMFGDGGWIIDRSAAQAEAENRWLRPLLAARARLVAIEIGAGTAIPTVRHRAVAVTRHGGTLIRINPVAADAAVEGTGLSLPAGALTALRAIDTRL